MPMPNVPLVRPSRQQSPASVARLPVGVPDAVLVGRARLGDRSAESLLYRRHAAALLSMVTRLLRSPHAAPTSRSYTASIPRSANSRSATTIMRWGVPSTTRPP